MLKKAIATLVAACGLLAPGVARGTYSIVAVDTTKGQVGAAGTSCVGRALSVITIYGSAPGKGALVAQARVSTRGRDEAVRLLEQSTSPEDIIDAITSPAFDPASPFGGASQRQYGIVDIAGRAAGYTGAGTVAYADDRQGSFGPFAYTAQGNILTGPAVLEQARVRFEEPACDLAARLMRALEGGAENGEGDSRCTPDGIPSDGAFIQVDVSDAPAGSYLRLQVDATAPENPVTLLRQRFDTWRVSNPCAAPPDAGVDGGATTDGGGTSSDGAPGATGGVPNGSGGQPNGAGGSNGAGGLNTGGFTGGSGNTGGAELNTGGSAQVGNGGGFSNGGAPAAPTAANDSDANGGCGCRTARSTTGGSWMVALLALGCLRRRWQSGSRFQAHRDWVSRAMDGPHRLWSPLVLHGRGGERLPTPLR